MQQHSVDYRTALAHSHREIFTADVYHGDDLLLQDLPVVNSALTVDRKATTRTAGTVDIQDPDGDLIPENVNDVLNPMVARIQLRKGIYHEFLETEEMFDYGYLVPRNIRIGESGDGLSFQMDCYDQASLCQSGISRPYTQLPGQKFEDAVQTLISTKLKVLDYRFATTGFLTNYALFQQGANIWDEAMHMATKGAGCDLFMGRTKNECYMVPAPSLTNNQQTPWEYRHGINATFSGVQREIHGADVPNEVVVVASHSSLNQGITGIASDNDPYSPTYVGGPYGRQTMVVQSEHISDQNQANFVAAWLLFQNLGPTESLSWSCIANPAMDVGDICIVDYPRLGILNKHVVVSSIQMPGRSDQMMQVEADRSVLTAKDGYSYTGGELVVEF